MSLRRIGLAAPLTLVVAVLGHLAGFGAHHAPGADHATALLTSLAAALALIAVGTILVAALRTDTRDGRPARQDRWLPLVLGVGGVAALGAIELAEGHDPFAAGLRALAAILPAAFLVDRLAQVATQVLRRSGKALAAMASGSSLSLRRFVTIRLPRFASPPSTDVRGSARGRAPPLSI